jgi:lipoate-protein ligase A
MLFVDNRDTTDPRLNLALEEFLLRQAKMAEPLLFLYINEPAVIIGRNQNVLQEADPAFLKKRNIHLVRRLSGGGTVYHDLDNLNYSFITQGQQDLHQFANVTEPIIRVLRDLGVDAELRGRSDIVVGGKKVSGNAQYASRGRMFTHGTLLFDSNIAELSRAIEPRHVQIESKAVQSVRSSVCNIRELLPGEFSIADLKRAILIEVFGPGKIPTLKLTGEDWDQVKQIAVERYMSWDWNIGRSPRFTLSNSGECGNGTAEVRVEVNRGFIGSIAVAGDCFNGQEIARLEKQLTGVRYDPEDLLAALRDGENEGFLAGFSKEAFVDLLY